MPLLGITALLRIVKAMLTYSKDNNELVFFSDFIVNALKVLLLILLFAAVFNSLYHSEKVSFKLFYINTFF